MKSTPSFVLAALSASLLAACGGSGGGDAGTAQSSAVVVTSGNQTDVARASVAGGMAMSLGGGGANQTNAPILAGGLRAAGLGRAAIESLRHAAGTDRRTAGSSSVVVACNVSGNVTSTFADNNNDGALSVGDAATIVYNDCRDSASTSVTGTLVVTLTSVSGNDFVATADLQNVHATDQGLTSSVNGQFTLSETTPGSQTVTALTIGAGGLVASVQSTSYTDSITFASGMRIQTVYDASTADTSLRMDGGFSSSRLGGDLTLTTVQPLVEHMNDTNPSSGQVRAVGANNGAVLMTVLNATQVQLQLDADGDGSYEGSTTMNWSTLIGQAG
jgi:hypothetical protein